MKKLSLSLYTTAATLAMAIGAPVLSQNLTLEEIIVTATKRAEGAARSTHRHLSNEWSRDERQRPHQDGRSVHIHT